MAYTASVKKEWEIGSCQIAPVRPHPPESPEPPQLFEVCGRPPDEGIYFVLARTRDEAVQIVEEDVPDADRPKTMSVRPIGSTQVVQSFERSKNDEPQLFPTNGPFPSSGERLFTVLVVGTYRAGGRRPHFRYVYLVAAKGYDEAARLARQEDNDKVTYTYDVVTGFSRESVGGASTRSNGHERLL